MKKIKGDLIALAIQGEFDLIIHGCNCFCTMGAGISKTIKSKFPNAYLADKETKILHKYIDTTFGKYFKDEDRNYLKESRVIDPNLINEIPLDPDLENIIPLDSIPLDTIPSIEE